MVYSKTAEESNMPRPSRTIRRQFFSSSVGALTSAIVAPTIISTRALGRGAMAPRHRVTVGIIGSGGRAVFETRQYSSFDNAVIVAVCDAQG
jgi:hypothetical protein